MNIKEDYRLILSDSTIFLNLLAFMAGYMFLLYQLNWYNGLVMAFTLFVFYMFTMKMHYVFKDKK